MTATTTIDEKIYQILDKAKSIIRGGLQELRQSPLPDDVMGLEIDVAMQAEKIEELRLLEDKRDEIADKIQSSLEQLKGEENTYGLIVEHDKNAETAFINGAGSQILIETSSPRYQRRGRVEDMYPSERAAMDAAARNVENTVLECGYLFKLNPTAPKLRVIHGIPILELQGIYYQIDGYGKVSIKESDVTHIAIPVKDFINHFLADYPRMPKQPDMQRLAEMLPNRKSMVIVGNENVKEYLTKDRFVLENDTYQKLMRALKGNPANN